MCVSASIEYTYLDSKFHCMKKKITGKNQRNNSRQVYINGVLLHSNPRREIKLMSCKVIGHLKCKKHYRSSFMKTFQMKKTWISKITVGSHSWDLTTLLLNSHVCNKIDKYPSNRLKPRIIRCLSRFHRWRLQSSRGRSSDREKTTWRKRVRLTLRVNRDPVLTKRRNPKGRKWSKSYGATLVTPSVI